MEFEIVTPILDKSVRSLCVRPYPNHKKGCPNFNKKEGCPPKAPLLQNLFDLSKPVYCIYNKFEFGEHVARMKNKHTHWTQRQAECCLYWQPRARKQLEEKIKLFLIDYPNYTILRCPEANGVNITGTMKQLGV